MSYHGLWATTELMETNKWMNKQHTPASSINSPTSEEKVLKDL